MKLLCALLASVILAACSTMETKCWGDGSDGGYIDFTYPPLEMNECRTFTTRRKSGCTQPCKVCLYPQGTFVDCR